MWGMVNPEIAAAIKKERVRIARLGGLGRAKKLTPKARKDQATKASRAAAAARIKKAKQKRGA
ncbi:MAG: hypothetical protein WCB56_17840 [Terriglobales bacterium]|jgi:hypothetical protein